MSVINKFQAHNKQIYDFFFRDISNYKNCKINFVISFI